MSREKIDLTKFKEWSDVKQLADAFQQFLGFSKWLLTVSLATEGFFIASLIQIKLQGNVKYPYFAFVVILCLAFSILWGALVRIRYEISHWSRKLVKSTKSVGNIIHKATIELSEKEDVEEQYLNLAEKFKNRMEGTSYYLMKYSKAANEKMFLPSIVIQGTFFALGILSISIYFVLYLFLQ